MSQNPFTGDVRRLSNQPSAYRRRVGNWRIFFDVNYGQRLIAVVAIERRTTMTYRKR
jgi:mRNA-degrading endonuclease RelE of RelBE toxin-antitoxin system